MSRTKDISTNQMKRDDGDRDMTRLNEYDKIEWCDVAKALCRDITDEEFETMWAEFQALKALYRRNLQ